MKKIDDWYDEQKLTKNNNKQLFLTEKQIRSFPQFRDKSDEEIQNIISTLHALSVITYELFATEVCDNERVMLAA